MKRVLSLMIVLILFLVPFTSAISTTLKSDYTQKETIITEIKGNILSPIKSSDVEFKRKNVPVPLDYGIISMGGKYFLWAIAPEKNETYTLVLHNVDTTINGKQNITTYEQNFSVNTNLTAYNMRPGVINSKEDFVVEINSFVDSDIAIKTNFPSEQNLILKPGKNSFSFSTGDVKETLFTSIKIGGYDVPLYVQRANVISVVNRIYGLYFEPSTINRRISVNDNPKYIISIKNGGNNTIENVQMVYDKSIFILSPDKYFNISSGKEMKLNLTIKNLVLGTLSNQIEARYGDSSTILPLNIEVSEQTSNTQNSSEPIFSYFCSELAGIKCASGESCSGESKDALDGSCCLGVCKSDGGGSSGGISNWIGYVLAIGIFAIIGYFLYRFKKSKKETAGDLAKELGQSKLSKMKEKGLIKEDKDVRVP